MSKGVWLALLLVLPAAARADDMVRIRTDHWTSADERGYGEFIAAIGESGCRTVDGCLHDSANPFSASDPPGAHFRSDCADLPYSCASITPGSAACPFPMSATYRRWAGRATSATAPAATGWRRGAT
jgi:hypothetical protein